jgi:hypothetical protein
MQRFVRPDLLDAAALTDFDTGLRLPCRRMRPSRWAMSAGRQGQSRWCSAIARACTLVPTPIFSVEPSSTEIRPLRAAANSSPFSLSLRASWT